MSGELHIKEELGNDIFFSLFSMTGGKGAPVEKMITALTER